MEINIAFLFKFIKFVIVGGISFIVDFGVTYIAKERIKLNKFVANTLGFCISATLNFNINRLWTFKSVDADIQMQFIRFICIAVGGLLINNLIVYYLTEKRQLNFYGSKFIAVFIVTFYNFTMNNLITFAK